MSVHLSSSIALKRLVPLLPTYFSMKSSNFPLSVGVWCLLVKYKFRVFVFDKRLTTRHDTYRPNKNYLNFVRCSLAAWDSGRSLQPGEVFSSLHKTFCWGDNEGDILFVSNGRCGARPGGQMGHGNLHTGNWNKYLSILLETMNWF